MTTDNMEQGDQGAANAAARADDGVAYLDQALWSQLQNPLSLEAFGAAWLTLLAQNIRRTQAGVLVIIDGADRQMRPAATWPRGWTPTPPVIAAAEAAIAERTGVARAATLGEGAAGARQERCQIAYPIIFDGATAGVVAFEMDIRPRQEITAALRQIQWAAAWVENAIRQRDESHRDDDFGRMKIALELFSSTLDTHGVEEAASAFVTELASALGCERVSLGAQRQRAMSMIALSHTATFDKRMNLIHSLTGLMEEAADQNAAIVMPQDRGGALVTREHRAYAESRGGLAIATAPFRIDDARAGVVLLERDKDKPFSDAEINLVMAVSALVGPIIADRLTIEKPIGSKVTEWASTELRKLVGPEEFTRKLAFGSLAAALLFCLFATGVHRVAADTRLEGAVRRSVVAPIDGFVERSAIRPGDRVEEGAELAGLDTADLRIERLHWLSEKRKASLEYAKAISSRDRAALGVLTAQIEQANARLELIDLQIARSTLTSPFAGIVVSGDLTQRIGAAVGRGEVLFEIAPLDDYRVIIEVDERDIDFVEPGQEGRLFLSSMPTNALNFVVRAVTPVSTPEDGANYFRVEAELLDEAARERLRPGMEGVAKIEIRRRRLVWIWTHEMVNWIRMTLWRWLP